jgi:drug/metabolite transporter (DMT)-like permease
VLSAIWGSAFMAIKVSVSTTNPITVASLRLIIGSIFLFAYYKFKGLKENLSIKVLLFIFLIGLIGNFIPFSLISWSEQYIQSNTAGLLLSVAPIFTLILSYFFIKEDKFFLKNFLSIFIGFFGVIFIFGFETLTNISLKESGYFFPKLAIIIAALGYVVSAILAYKIKHISTITLTTFVTISAAFISLPFMIVAEFSSLSSFNFNSLLSLFYLGLFPTAIAFVLRFHLISKAGPVFLSYVAYLIPVFAIVWGYIFLKETISQNTLIGIVLILLGVLLSSQRTNV